MHRNRWRIPAIVLSLLLGTATRAGSPGLARRFFHALVGNGKHVRYALLPYEGHHYWARESVLHVAAEMLAWLERTLTPVSE